jgi:hypothetical protein
MTYFGAAGLLIALAAAGVALYLGIGAQQDAAKKSDLNDVKAEVSQVRTEAAAATEQKLKTINATLTALQSRVAAAEAQAQQAKQAAASAGAAGAALGLPTTPTTPTPSTGSATNKSGAGKNTGGKSP